MFLSLVVILVPLAIIVAIFSQGPTQATVQTVNWKPVAAEASQQSPYPILTPIELPAGWRATRVSWTRVGQPDPAGNESVRNRWQLGVLTDSNVYLELDQGDKFGSDMVDDLSNGGHPDGKSLVNGQTWTRLVTDDNQTRTLVLTEPGVTTMVSGDTDYTTLETYAGLLHTQPKT